jgi:hypothetical protein
MIERIKDWSPFLAFVFLGILVIMMFKRCGMSPQPAITVIPEQARTDSFRTVIKYQDSTRIKTIVNHRTVVKTVLKDSTPCYTEIVEVVKSCEKVIAADSILIGSLKSQHINDSTIIFKQFIRIKGDSAHIVKLDKKVKRNRRMALFFGAIVAGGVGVKLIP